MRKRFHVYVVGKVNICCAKSVLMREVVRNDAEWSTEQSVEIREVVPSNSSGNL